MAEGNEEPTGMSAQWEREDHVPDDDHLYCYVHKSMAKEKPSKRAFQNTPSTGNNLSSDWSKYSTPEQTRARLAKQKKLGKDGNYKEEFKRPEDYYVVQLRVGHIRTEISSQQIEHDPIQGNPDIPDNLAHTIIIGEKDEEVRLKFVDIAEWAIPPTT